MFLLKTICALAVGVPPSALGFVVPQPVRLFPKQYRPPHPPSPIPHLPSFRGSAENERLLNNFNQGIGMSLPRLEPFEVGDFPDYPGSLDLFSGVYGPDFSPCAAGEVLNIDGSCERPIVTRNFFLYAAPRQPIGRRPRRRPPIPRPRINYNVVLIRSPETLRAPDPIVIPPPQEKTLVYVLNKLNDLEQDVIQVSPSPLQRPEVFYINYSDGESPQLPFGLDLQTALDSTTLQSGTGDALVDDPATVAARVKAKNERRQTHPPGKHSSNRQQR